MHCGFFSHLIGFNLDRSLNAPLLSEKIPQGQCPPARIYVLSVRWVMKIERGKIENVSLAFSVITLHPGKDDWIERRGRSLLSRA